MLKYPKVLSLDELRRIPEDKTDAGEWLLEEKYDGSNFRAYITDSGNIIFGSKEIDYVGDRMPDAMFVKAINTAKPILEKIKDEYRGTMFFFEFISKNKHGALKYDRVPKNNLVLFDIFAGMHYLRSEDKERLANDLGFEKPHSFGIYKTMPPLEEVKKLVQTESSLGGTMIEGIVFKNYAVEFEYFGMPRFASFKYVRDEYKEVQRKEWKETQGTGKDAVFNYIINNINKDAVWQKAYMHAMEQSKINNTMEDLVNLIELVNDDLTTEYKGEIADMLFEKFKREIVRRMTHGLAEWYKDKLYKSMEEAVNKSEG